MDRVYLPDIFREFGAVLPDVNIVDVWGYYDGPLFGVCEIAGIELFFVDCVFDTRRHYSEEESNRLWAIYSVYDVVPKQIKKLIYAGISRNEWHEKLEDENDVIGVFWEYTQD